ncbi:hypothetical protein [Burkholderia cepacia]|uniref:hypothetical protein n=1 Tax=Burkholderia cepacia TaxID=292 RepID=UPI0006654DCF|nr:hypothetical protein [Burkholderia cepacia]
MNPLSPIEDVCQAMRAIFVGVMIAGEISSTKGRCLQASIMLERALDQMTDGSAIVRGGDGASDGGACDVMGKWHGHYWVEGVTVDGQPFVADITADQFGWPEVVVLPLPFARRRYQPGDDELCGHAVDEQVDQMLATMGLARD